MPINTLKENQHMQIYRRGGSLSDCVSQFLRCATMSIGVLSAWMDFVNISRWESLFFLVMLMLVLTAGLAVYRFSSELARKLPLMFVVFAIMTAILGNLKRLFEGLVATINMGIAYWNIKEEDAFPYLLKGAGSQEGLYLLGIVLVFCIAAICWYFSWKGAVTSSFIMSTIALVPGILLKSCSFYGIVFITLGLMSIWLHSVKAGSWRMRLSWTILGGAIFVSIVGLAGNGEIKSIIDFRNKSLVLLDKARFGEDTLPEGDLTKAYAMKQDDTVRLRITTDEERALYLRGYTAGRYENGQWKPLKRSAYSGKRYGFMKWLENQNFDPNSEFALSKMIDKDYEDTKALASSIKIQNLRANRKYFYTLYSTGKPDGSHTVTSKRDEGYRSNALSGAEKYEIFDYSDNIPGELNKLEDWMYSPDTQKETDYLESEAVYRSFVYDSYMEIGNDLLPLIEKIFHDSSEEDDTKDSPETQINQDSAHEVENKYESIYTVTQKIREIMREKMVYSPTPAQPDEGEDPLKPFLRGERVGNAAFFASAGVLAFRSYGIPARYVEGYLKDRTGGADGAKIINLRSINSHAWVEVYMDGLGWVPIDVTPGYYYDTYTLLQMSTLPDDIQRASVADESDSNTDNSLGLKGEEEQIQDKPEEDIVISMAISGGILLVAFLFLFIVTGAEYKALFEDWKIEGLLARSEKEDTVDAFARGIEKQLARIGIEMHVGWQIAETEERLISTIPEVSHGEYARVNELLEKWIYGDKKLEQYEIRVLYAFLKKIKTMIDRYYRRNSFSLMRNLKKVNFADGNRLREQ